MKRKLCCKVACLAIALGCCIVGYSQAQNTMSDMVNKESDKFHIKRTIPKGFHFIEDNRSMVFDTCWDKRRDLGGIWKKSWHRIAALGAVLQSDDRQCEVIYHYIIEGQFHDIRNPTTYRGAYMEQRWGHRDVILGYLMAQLGRSDIAFDDYVTVTSGREARRRFNADSVFVFEIPIEPQHWDGEVYTRCICMYLSRKDRAYMGFVWLFTDEGYKRKQEYLDALEGNAAYKKGRWHKPDWIKRTEKAARQ